MRVKTDAFKVAIERAQHHHRQDPAPASIGRTVMNLTICMTDPKITLICCKFMMGLLAPNTSDPHMFPPFHLSHLLPYQSFTNSLSAADPSLAEELQGVRLQGPADPQAPLSVGGDFSADVMPHLDID